MLLPGAQNYSERCFTLAHDAAGHIPHVTDIAYGSDPFQKLDLWVPTRGEPGPMPLIVFFHGGAWRNGYKEWIGAMAPTLTALPAVLAAPNYRLVPHVRLEQVVEDGWRALAWLGHHAAHYGADTSHVILAGHSAGAYLAARLASDTRRLIAPDMPALTISSCISVSGVFGFSPDMLLPHDARKAWLDELFSTPQDAQEASLDNHLHAEAPTCHFIVGQHDLPEVLSDHARIQSQADKLGMSYTATTIEGADHFEAHLACLDPHSELLARARRPRGAAPRRE